MCYNDMSYDKEYDKVIITFLDDDGINSEIRIEIPFDQIYQLKHDIEVIDHFHSSKRLGCGLY